MHITLKSALKVVMALAYFGAGVNHFVNTAFYLSIMPPYIPLHLAAVYVSGVCETALGVLLLVPGWTRTAAWGLIALLVAVFPANVHMAMHPELFPQFHPIGLLIRLPIQGVLIAWAWWYTRAEPDPVSRTEVV